MIDRDDLQWYRDAVIYQLNVKSYFDANHDGVGDFAGLTQKLDYIKDLGVTAIWVMPFYPSPMRDDGYDIAHYRGINRAYGGLRDFKLFLREAHGRSLRVITELVINHTSDQHPWFKRARAAKPGSVARNFYVWADSDRGYKDAPVVFLDTEKSNWTWDEEAKAFYWHRFFSHQPDLNFDNPRVVKAILDVMAYWLDMGVDGLRMDAVPYLIEREGTNCENLPETHAVIKKLRAAIDARYPDRMLLAEANLWPEEAAQYFGQGDECHMAFHFPLMPRIYMALAQEDRHPITDIMRQTPDVPDGAQWAIFLRNHDEMTLATVTSSERDYLWSFYAADPRARLHLGIRRRLAPLLENDRRKIELLNSLLLSMPGTPIIYYGDEIGMGDNIYLGDRDGVRTPMQWSPDRNGGFSRVDPARLFLPAIQDPIYGFSTVNVEAQLASSASLLTWMRRLIAVRRSHLSFGRGTLRFLHPSNRKVLAYLREFENERILCVANVSRAPQAVKLDLSEFEGAIPVELTAGSLFPSVEARDYLLTLPAYGFYWFRLEPAEAVKEPAPPTAPGLFTLVATGKLETVLMGRERVAFEKTVAPHVLLRRRWFHHKSTPIADVRVRDFAVLRNGGQSRFILPLLDVERSDGTVETYFAPLAAEPEREDGPDITEAIARLRRGPLTGLLYEATDCESFVPATVTALQQSENLDSIKGGRIVFSPTPRLGPELMIEESDVRRIGRGKNNSSLVLANQLLLKVKHEITPRDDPEIETLRFLTETAQFPHAPPLLGTIEYVDENAKRSLLATLQIFIRNQGDAWTWTLNALRRIIETAALTAGQEASAGLDAFAIFVPYMRRLGCRTAEMHKALATPSPDPHFGVADLTFEDIKAAAEKVRSKLPGAFQKLQAQSSAIHELTAAQRLLARWQNCCDLIDGLVQPPIGAVKIRIHGDYGLQRLLVVKDDIMIVGFGDKPVASLQEARRKASPLADVATLLCSLAHAVAGARTDLARLIPDVTLAAAKLRDGLILFSQVFIDAYRENLQNSRIWVADERTRKDLIVLFLLDELFHAIETAAEGQSEWIDTAADAILVILERMSAPA
ncbi:MAG TPA: maltose alpha-D-glucosyltransferase [Methylocella sp.]|nr:maltose alpha-D-glucosyltransferase [Methylocella sp.]